MIVSSSWIEKKFKIKLTYAAHVKVLRNVHVVLLSSQFLD